ncbi:MAG: regulatory iron-sulfur-containing complex subunit RicT [Bacteroidales bacterium]|jgi:cell fate regulator YaaT (PSP1 superfamily)|nr:regulatory iron-sulfur-containing complex subunit RicT [Bacteroidales bacterium]
MNKSRELEHGCRVCEIDESANEFNIAHGCYKLDVYDWLNYTPQTPHPFDIVEIRFKNTRKSYFENVNGLPLRIGDILAVEGSPGHDIGIVSLTGELVKNQLRKKHIPFDTEFKKVYRKAKPADIKKWKEAVELEIPTMLRTREMIKNLGLDMKLGDVEFQGDKTKAIFYYIAEERVDFRELIKIMADEFRIRVEMKQIGARQEAGRLGGIGPCGRELCCTTWLSDFKSATTHAARTQELSPNPQKLAGQCGKLKCCINFELPVYLYERKKIPKQHFTLKTKQGDARHVKNDIFKHLMYYEIIIDNAPLLTALPIERVKEIIELNKQGILVDNLLDTKTINTTQNIPDENDYTSDLNQGNINRFENKGKQKRRKPKSKKHRKT